MKSQNKYHWFLFILLLWAIDNGAAAVYYLFPNTNDEEWMFRAQVYTSSLVFINSFIYFFIGNLKRFKPMDNVDRVFALLCGIMTVYNSLRLVFGAIYMSDIYYWLVWAIIFLGLLYYRIRR